MLFKAGKVTNTIMVLTLYKLDASPPARAVMMILEALELDAELVDINLFEREHLKEEFVKMNPQHTVPTLKDDSFVVWDCHAIVAYLVNTYSKDDALYPKDSKKRAIVDQRLHFDSGILFPAIRNTLEPVLFWGEKLMKKESLAKIEPAYNFCEKFLDKQWIAGDQLSIADICCFSTISSLNCMVPIDQNKFPKLCAWLGRCSNLDFAKKANSPGLKDFMNLLKDKFP